MHLLLSRGQVRSWTAHATFLAGLFAGCVFLISAGAGVATALPPLTASQTSTLSAVEDTSNSLAGLEITGGDPSATLRISVAADIGTISIPTNTNLTLASGFSGWTDEAEIAFTGQRADVNAALATLTFDPGPTAGSTAHLELTAQEFYANMAYSSPNGHFYEYVADPMISFDAARVAAASRTYGGHAGYLASIPNAEVNAFVAERIPGATNLWFGAVAVNAADGSDPIQRSWSWSDGPLANDVFLQCATWDNDCAEINGPDAGGAWPLTGMWDWGEPNNYNGLETAAVTNWNGISGRWNDLDPTEVGAIQGYLVEYGDLTYGASGGFSGVASATSSISVVGPPGATSATPSPVQIVPDLRLASIAFGTKRIRPAASGSRSLRRPRSRPRRPAGQGPRRFAPMGSTLTVMASEASTLSISMTRYNRGRMVGGKCRIGGTSLGRAKRCTVKRTVRDSGPAIAVGAGETVLWFTGRAGNKRLPTGAYNVVAKLTSADGQTSNTQDGWIRIVKRL